MTTPNIEDGTANNPILLTDENSTTSIRVQPTDPPVIFERSRPFGNGIKNLPEYVVRTLFEWIQVGTILSSFIRARSKRKSCMLIYTFSW